MSAHNVPDSRDIVAETIAAGVCNDDAVRAAQSYMLATLKGVLEDITEDLKIGLVSEGAAGRIQEPVAMAIAQAEAAGIKVEAGR